MKNNNSTAGIGFDYHEHEFYYYETIIKVNSKIYEEMIANDNK